MYKFACFVNVLAVEGSYAIWDYKGPDKCPPLLLHSYSWCPVLSLSLCLPFLCLTHTLTHISISLPLVLSRDNRAGWTEMAFWMTQVGTSFSLCITGWRNEWYSLAKPLLMFWHNSTFININETELLFL